MTELPEDVARELDDLFGLDDVPRDAVTIDQMVRDKGFSDATWRQRMKQLIEEGTWARGKRPGAVAYWYWKIEDEQR